MAENIEFNQKTDIIRTVRKTAAQSCLFSMQKLFSYKKKVSEVKLANTWIKFMEKTNKIHGYWYQPPPGGTSVIFFGKQDYSKFNYLSLRDKKQWPNSKSYLEEEGGGYFYTSPFYFLNDTPLIGNFGFSFYTGKSEKIKDHYRNCYNVLNLIINLIRPGFKFSQLYSRALKIMKKNGLTNLIASVTDKKGTNIGHTIPFLNNNITRQEKELIAEGNEEKIYSLINKSRDFLNLDSDYVINNNCGFTLEPRFISEKNSDLPMFSMHHIIIIQNGRKEVMSNFGGIFNFLNINYLN